MKNWHSDAVPFTAAGDWKRLRRPIPGHESSIHDFSYNAGTHQISQVDQNGTALGVTAFGYDSRGNRSGENVSFNADRTYTYDARRNVATVTTQYQVWFYTPWVVTSAYDANNRRVFKAVQEPGAEPGLGKTAHWFFYYDPIGRLTEVHHTPDISNPTTNSVFQLIWLGDRIVLYWQTDYPSETTSKRYVSSDELGRPVDMVCWGTGTGCPRVWGKNPDAWGFDKVLVGADVYQPLLFPGQYSDEETTAFDGSNIHRPPLALDGTRT